jgi:hypothetical protein
MRILEIAPRARAYGIPPDSCGSHSPRGATNSGGTHAIRQETQAPHP